MIPKLRLVARAQLNLNLGTLFAGRFAGWALAAALACGFAPALVAASDLPATQVQRYSIDPYRSYLTFTIGFMKLKNVDGTYHDYTGTIMFDDRNLTGSTVTAAIRAESIFTGVRPRDRHLRGPDFFDVDKYPVILFRSSEVSASGSGLRVRGSLTMHGTTLPVTLSVSHFEKLAGTSGDQRLHFQASARLRRHDFGVVGNFWGDKVLSDEVQVDLNVEAVPLAAPEADPMETRGVLRLEDALLPVIEQEGVAAATEKYRKLRYAQHDRYDFSPDALLRMAETLAGKGRVEEALALVRLNLEANPRHEPSRDRLGFLLLQTGDLPGSLAVYQDLLRLNPYNTAASEMLRWLQGPSANLLRSSASPSAGGERRSAGKP